MAKRKVKWQAGDNFLVPLQDGSYGQGQVLSHEARAMNSVICAFSSIRFENVPDHLGVIPDEGLIAVLFTTRDLLDSGRWHVVNSGPIVPWGRFLNIQELRSKGYVGVTVRGSLIVADFLNAYHKLIAWNGCHDPGYFDKLLVSPDRKPPQLLLM
jgi:hypothetical protein